MTHILFATNRQPVPTAPGAIADFGDAVQAPGQAGLLCGSADIADIDVMQPSSGRIAALSPTTAGHFSEAALAPLLASQNDILVFVHGCANSFHDAITRAAYNKTWLGMADTPGTSTVCDVIAFSWPARAYVIANIVGDFVDYRHDQAQAAASSDHFGFFLQQIAALRQRIGARRINLLCHSMGNFMLAGTLEKFCSAGTAPAAPIFDQIVLAAADEIATSFTTPHAGRLARLPQLGHAITVYFDNDDIAMALSHIANQNFRLGYAGPPNAADRSVFPAATYGFVDCTGVNDYISSGLNAPDRSHQYYRQSPTVRADIIATLAGVAPKRLGYNAATNMFALFPPVVLARGPGGPGNEG
jgi:esterase/lipase superfamily enzyme